MPSVREQFKSYHQFASASLEDIYGDRLNEAARHQITTLESAVFINDGDGQQPRFEFRPLPNLAQIAPVFGLAATDANSDGHLDLILAQNFYSPQRETGRMAGGLGLLLKGDGTGAFTPAWPRESGILIPEDAKSLSLCDTNEDGVGDFVVGVNNGQMQHWQGQSHGHELLGIRLDGPPGNRHAAGAQITLTFRNGIEQIHEMQAGAGYLSQQPPIVLAPHSELSSIQIRWPRGTLMEITEFPKSGYLKVEYPVAPEK